MPDKKQSDDIAQFCGVTGSTTKEAKKFLDKYKRVDVAIDAFYNEPQSLFSTLQSTTSAPPSQSKLSALFDRYKDQDGPDISVDGTIKMCAELEVDPEDVVLLAVAYELKSPRIGEWTKQGWIDGWKSIGCDSITSMKAALPKLRTKLGSDPEYFQKVYNHTFDFARLEGQRSLGLETAQAFWGLLLPVGLNGGALSHQPQKDTDEDVDMGGREGLNEEHVQWWFEFLSERGGKGVSKDTWVMFLDFVRSIDARFQNYDMEAAWPSTIDDFVEWSRNRLARA